MFKHTAIFCAIVISHFCIGSSAAESNPASNLKDAVERAIMQNPEVKLRFQNLQAARSEQRVAEGAWYPRIDLEVAGGGYQTRKPSLPATLGYSSNRANLQLRQTLFDGFASSNEVQRLSFAQQGAYHDLISVSNQTALETARAYLDVLRYRELVQLAADNYTSHEEVHDRLSQKVKAGVGRKVDLEQAAGRMALAESNWLTEVSNLHDVSSRYIRLVGEVPAASLAPVESVGTVPQELATAKGQLIRQNPEFQSAVANLRSFRADSKLRKAPYAPTLELRARQSVETNQSGVSGDFQDTSLELVLNYNLFRGGSDKARVDQYVAKFQSAYELRDKVCRDVWQTASIAMNDAQKLTTQIQFLSQHELSTSKARQAYQQQFDIGQRSLLDLLDTENELYQARRALTSAEYDLKLGTARILAVSGSLLGALQLQPLSAPLDQSADHSEPEDDALQCIQQSPVLPVLEKLPPSSASVANPEPESVVTAPSVPVPQPVPAAKVEFPECKQLNAAVSDWLQAWNSKDVPKYLASYSSGFVPANGMSRRKWETFRKNRVSKQGDVQITTSAITAVGCNSKTAEVTFTQQYKSSDYSDQVEKTLSFENAQGAWKIIKETVTQGRNF